MFKKTIQRLLEGYAKKYLRAHPEIKLVAVAGSVGKTSTKVAIGTVLAEGLKVRMHEGNHNAELSTPLAILGIEYPDTLRDPAVWRNIFKQAKQKITAPVDVDVIVQEVGTDRIGQIPHFGTFAHPDIAVVTSVSSEHMEYFKTIDAVAREELSIAKFSKEILVNSDDIDEKYIAGGKIKNVSTYGLKRGTDSSFVIKNFSLSAGFKGTLKLSGSELLDVTVQTLGEHTLGPVIAASAVAIKLGLSPTQIKKGVEAIRPVSGRMNVLKGIRGSTIIDDSYNSSPLAVSAALRTLYELKTPQKIAVLGSMNELGATSTEEHSALGKLCDPSQLDLVITVGTEAEKYIAPAAADRGCQVKSFTTSPEAGEFIKDQLKTGAVILFKGSQGGVFLEEAIKVVLASKTDEKKLVRQSATWLKQKQAFFAKNR